MGDDAIAALRVRHAQDRVASGLPSMKPSPAKEAAKWKGGSKSPKRRSPPPRSKAGGRRSPTEEPTTPARVDAHKELLAELERVPGDDTPPRGNALLIKGFEEQQEFHDLGRQAMRSSGSSAMRIKDSQHRRLAGHRHAKRNPKKAFAALGGLATWANRESTKCLPPAGSPPRRLDALPGSPSAEPTMVVKGDEVNVWPGPGVAPKLGIVQAIWQSRRTTRVVDRVIVPCALRREFLVRFELGADWVSEEDLVSTSNPHHNLASTEISESVCVTTGAAAPPERRRAAALRRGFGSRPHEHPRQVLVRADQRWARWQGNG